MSYGDFLFRQRSSGRDGSTSMQIHFCFVEIEIVAVISYKMTKDMATSYFAGEALDGRDSMQIFSLIFLLLAPYFSLSTHPIPPHLIPPHLIPPHLIPHVHRLSEAEGTTALVSIYFKLID